MRVLYYYICVCMYVRTHIRQYADTYTAYADTCTAVFQANAHTHASNAHTHASNAHTEASKAHTEASNAHTEASNTTHRPVIVRSSSKLTLILGLGVSSGGGGAGGTLGGTSQHCLQRQNVYFCTSKASKASNLQLQTAAQDLNALPRSLTYHSLR
jgi:hypothetical protein